jgi:hypothetical protein
MLGAISCVSRPVRHGVGSFPLVVFLVLINRRSSAAASRVSRRPPDSALGRERVLPQLAAQECLEDWHDDPRYDDSRRSSVPSHHSAFHSSCIRW